MSSRFPDDYRIRVGDYRVLSVVDDAARLVRIRRVRHRREAYREVMDLCAPVSPELQQSRRPANLARPD